MKIIVLTNGIEVMVDDSDYDSLKSFTWWAHKGKSTWYAARKIRPSVNGMRGYKSFTILMHRQIIGKDCDCGRPIDHINGNGLDNRRCNLRVVTPAQNTRNSRKMHGCSSRFKGVYFQKKIQKWVAQISIDGTQNYIGCFVTEEAAALAWNEAAARVDPEHARFNVVEGTICCSQG